MYIENQFTILCSVFIKTINYPCLPQNNHHHNKNFDYCSSEIIYVTHPCDCNITA